MTSTPLKSEQQRTGAVSGDHAHVQPPERLSLTVKEAAAALGISYTSAHLAAMRGEIPSIVIGRRRLVPRAALDRLLAGDMPLPTASTNAHPRAD